MYVRLPVALTYLDQVLHLLGHGVVWRQVFGKVGLHVRIRVLVAYARELTHEPTGAPAGCNPLGLLGAD